MAKGSGLSGSRIFFYFEEGDYGTNNTRHLRQGAVVAPRS